MHSTQVTDKAACAGLLPPVCYGCKSPILDSSLHKVQDEFWHKTCLRCVVCRKELNGCCYAKESRPYCRTDFTRSFGTKCSGCQGIISPSEIVHVTNDNVYHVTCFICLMCGTRIDPGDCFYLREDNKLLCKTDYNSLEKKVGTKHSDSDSDESDDDRKRQTNRINSHSLRMLSEYYHLNRKPSRQDLIKLSQTTGLKPRLIKMWFQTRRSKERHANTGTPKNCFQGTGMGSESFVEILRKPASGNDHQLDFISDTSAFGSLDFMIPNAMPPNVDLSATEIKNGEVTMSANQSGLQHRRVAEGTTTSATPCYSWLMASY